MKRILYILIPLLFLSFTKPFYIRYKVLFTLENFTISGKKVENIKPILYEVLDNTTDDLSFSLHSKISDIKTSKKANCIGYTKYYNFKLTEKLKEKGIGNISISHARVKILLFGINVHVFNSNSWKDHDVSIVKNNTTGDVYYVDPSLSEVFGDIIVKQ
jgi:hypothetical protein